MEEQIFDFTDESGTLRPFEEIMEDIKGIYSNIEKETKEVKQEKTLGTLEELLTMEGDDVGETLFENRCFYLDSDICDELAKNFLTYLQYWNIKDSEIPQEERKPIQIFINTNGGDVDATFLIVDAIKMSKTPVHTITVGKGFSGGFFIGICGHKRFAFPNATFLFHEGAMCNSDNVNKYYDFADFHKCRLQKLKKLVLTNTTISESDYDERRKDDWYFFANDAKTMGVIDEISTKLI